MPSARLSRPITPTVEPPRAIAGCAASGGDGPYPAREGAPPPLVEAHDLLAVNGVDGFYVED